jgi:hypothetical protein
MTALSSTNGISKLSADALALIFEEVVAVELYWEDRGRVAFTTPAPFSTLASSSELAVLLSHVCRDWNAVAVNTASLWISPAFKYDDGMDFEMLRRAKKAPLKLTIHYCGREETVPMIRWFGLLRTEFIAQVEQLWIEAPASVVVSLLRHSHILRSLHLPWSINKPLGSSDYVLPLSSPTTLCLDEVRHFPPLSLFDSVTRLHVGYSDPSPADLRELIAVIRRAPNLIDFNAELAYRVDWEWIGVGTQPNLGDAAELPHLQALTLTGDFVCCTAIKRHIILGTGPLRLTFGGNNNMIPDGEQEVAFEAFVRSHTSQPSTAPVIAEITATNEYKFSVVLYSADESVTTFILRRSEEEDGVGAWRQRCHDLIGYIQWGKLRILHLDIEDVDMARHILFVVDAFQSELLELQLSPESCFAGFSALNMELHADNQTLFPSLRSLKIREVRMLRNGDETAGQNCGRTGFFPAYGRLGALLYTLEFRQFPEESPVHKVVLKDCLFGSTKKSLVKKTLLRYVTEVKIE